MWEITGAEFSKSEAHTADGISIRFPRCTRIRDDKDWKSATDLPKLKVPAYTACVSSALLSWPGTPAVWPAHMFSLPRPGGQWRETTCHRARSCSTPRENAVLLSGFLLGGWPQAVVYAAEKNRGTKNSDLYRLPKKQGRSLEKH